MASQTLLHLIGQLQQIMSVAQGRSILLDYARKCCSARLALLFALDTERKALILVDHAGRHPHPSAFSLENTPVELSLKGLFAATLKEQSFVNVPDISHHPLSLVEERSLAWPHGRVLLHALRQGTHRGVLAFCFSPAGSRTIPSTQAEEELLICASLLSAYVHEGEAVQPVYGRGEKYASARGNRSTETGEPDTLSTPADSFDLLLTLCALGMLNETQPGPQELEQRILRSLVTAFHVQDAHLWSYEHDQKFFRLRPPGAKPDALTKHASTVLNTRAETLSNAGSNAASGLVELSTDGKYRMHWHILRYHAQVLGAVGLVIEHDFTLTHQQHVLLDAACELVALLLLHTEQHFNEQQKLIESERTRIAYEIHDSVMQDLAHVTQKLDYVQHFIDKQQPLVRTEVEQARNLLTRSLHDLRYGLTALLPVSLEEQGIEKAIKGLLREYNLSTPQLTINCEVDNLALWPRALQTPIYRFLQEALNNIRKHAQASTVTIRIHHIASVAVVQISDDGQGFAPEHVTQHRHGPQLGLLTMEERIRQAGGVFELYSRPGKGTTLKARFVFPPSATILTEREREVLRLLVEGLTNRAISDRLSISLETVKSHVHHIMQKMHVKDRTQAAVVATKRQWL